VSILKIITIPHPVLKIPALQVPEISAAAVRLAADLADTMRSNPHCVGIAAPQVGRSLRIIVIDVSLHLKPHTNHGLLMLVNPTITDREGRKTGREGCLSVPDFTGNVSRAEKISVAAFGPDGKCINIDAEGFEAGVLQHEIDHLDGLLFLDRVVSLRTDVFRRKNI
jgi:peptide deformylase